MNIRTQLTLLFILITAVIILMGSVMVYLFSADYREENFYNRLKNKANNTAKLLIEVDEVDAALLRKMEQDNPVSLPNEKIIIFNYRDSLLFSTDEDNAILIDKKLLDQVRLEDNVRFRKGEYEILGFLFKGQYDRFVVVAAATDIFGFRKLKNLLFILAIVFAISIVIVSISGWFYAGRALRSIARVVDQVNEISISSLNLRVDEGNGQDEIARLGKTFNDMLARLETSFLTQKNFIANASHELRTPLTAITGQLEVTLLNLRSPEDYRKVITSVFEDIKNINTLSNKLLLLAETSAEEREKKMTRLRIDELMWQSKEELEKHYPKFIIKIDLDGKVDDENKLTIKGDPQLLKTALSNIIENGCKYSIDHTTKILISSSGSLCTLKFEDQGIGIPPEDIPGIFEPFYRGNNTKNTKGHGIGLSMVKSIVKLHKGAIELTSSEGKGTIVLINFPINES